MTNGEIIKRLRAAIGQDDDVAEVNDWIAVPREQLVALIEIVEQAKGRALND